MFNFKVCGFAAGAAFLISFLLGLFNGSAFSVLIGRSFIFAFVFFILSGIINLILGRFLPELLENDDTAGNQSEKADMPGAHINFSEDDSPVMQAGPENAALADDSEGNIGDISAIYDEKSGGEIRNSASDDGIFATHGQSEAFQTQALDQNIEDEYTTNNDADTFSMGFESFAGGEGTGAALPEAPKAAAAHTHHAAGSISAMFDGIAGLPGETDGSDILPDMDSLEKAFSSESGGGMEEVSDFSSPVGKKQSKGGKDGLKMDKDYSPKEFADSIKTLLKKED
ncbi:MAG: hypothetical protein LBH43_02620 [Treponema sp.]|jgi:hypothetical protein|nr:hypothetical protein [Treponema sp.]